MAKEIFKEKKCLSCGIIMTSVRADKKTCSDYCRKKYNSCIATVGNTEYKKGEISSKAKELFDNFQSITDLIERCQDLILYTDKNLRADTDKDSYIEKFKLFIIGHLESIKKHSDRLIDEITEVEITEVQEILDELDDRDNDRNENLFN